ncbi:SRPBCC family protein [Hoyosella sp. YIM 151337]|uniref:SRPBCC family protein n=1 Tax=Hoyosella sp. YIM 151337 TaxID=2992742 RepID=UPI0022357584|nr:SRPBCC family protein [Hoyosella sp. YIM 151337]MCW4353080.1 SRPBCC family protein [Hoyosella sp. YIM 151337]
MPSPLLEAEIETSAAADKVWSIVSDLPRMSEWSPRTRKTVILGGQVREGALAFNINKKGKLYWPTRTRIVTVEPNEQIAFKVLDNNSVWSFTLEPTDSGTRIIQRREAPNGTSAVSRTLVKLFLGGNEDFEADLVAGMRATLERIKAEAER